MMVKTRIKPRESIDLREPAGPYVGFESHQVLEATLQRTERFRQGPVRCRLLFPSQRDRPHGARGVRHSQRRAGFGRARRQGTRPRHRRRRGPRSGSLRAPRGSKRFICCPSQRRSTPAFQRFRLAPRFHLGFPSHERAGFHQAGWKSACLPGKRTSKPRAVIAAMSRSAHPSSSIGKRSSSSHTSVIDIDSRYCSSRHASSARGCSNART